MRISSCYLPLVAAALALGCVTVAAPDTEHSAYLTAKTATYAAWRFDGAQLADMQEAQPHLQSLYTLLAAADEAELGVELGEYLAGWAELAPLQSDRILLRELTETLLTHMELRDPELLESQQVSIARSVIGGILDGIALAELGEMEE